MGRRTVIDIIRTVNKQNFNEIAIEIFKFQSKNNKVFGQYLDLIDKKNFSPQHYSEIPFLPISFFKTHTVVTENHNPELYFESSSTGGQGLSRHYIKSLDEYLEISRNIFWTHIGPLSSYSIFGLLPAYLERSRSSLVNMVQDFMLKSQLKEEAFYLYEHEKLYNKLKNASNPLLFGVSFALLDFAEEYSIHRNDLLIIETGGMKGRKKEITKIELYQRLKKAFPEASIISEYGMTELMSQAYSNTEGLYQCPAWMKVLCRTDTDPLGLSKMKGSGALNIIDLTNLHSCSFIATDDLGILREDNRFEVSGRLDQSDTRGCSLMIA